MRSVLPLLVALFFAPGTALADIREIIVAGDDETAETEVFFLNEGTDVEPHMPPSSLVLDGRTLWRVGKAATRDIAPGNFVRVLYRAEAETTVAGTNGIGVAPDKGVNPTGFKKFETYQPMYALLGADPRDAKLQLSFKYLLLGERPQSRSENLRWGIYFGYTQQMFWDLEQESIPIRDFTFSPELFFYLTTAELPKLGRPQFSMQAGVQHESNGRGGLQSRSLNTLYIEPSVTLALGNDWQLRAAPRAWAYFGNQDNNEQIERFRGYSGLTVALGKPQSYGARGYFRLNPVRGKGSAEIDVFYSLAQKSSLDVAVHAQLFSGYGETLLDYDQRSTRLRVGLSIAR